jgi:hypothetical protein
MWKLQTIVKMQPRIRTRESLPTPPKGMDWEQDEETHEWRLIPAAKNTSERPPRPPAPSCESVPLKVIAVDRIPQAGGEEKLDDDEWDLCSEKHSAGSFGGAVVVNRSGSVRSINSHENSASALSIPFKIQRTLSSSTIDSSDADRVMGLPGIDYTGLRYQCYSTSTGEPILRELLNDGAQEVDRSFQYEGNPKWICESPRSRLKRIQNSGIFGGCPISEGARCSSVSSRNE